MLSTVPFYVSVIFMLTTLTTLLLIYFAVKRVSPEANVILILLCVWIFITGMLALQGFFSNTNVLPPRLMFAVILTLLVIIILFKNQSSREFLDRLPLSNITYLNIVRVPVEFVLFWLFTYKAVPELMTFEGRNFDILAGFTAPIMGYLFFTKKILSRKALLIWNFICLGLLLNIVVNAILSAPFPFQKFAFDQPNVGVLYFPFIWLPVFIVPVILLGHLVSIRQLLK